MKKIFWTGSAVELFLAEGTRTKLVWAEEFDGSTRYQRVEFC